MSNLSELLPAGSSVKSADFVAQGTLASGVTVALRSDGKVEAISATGGPPSAGTPVEFETGNIQDQSGANGSFWAAYDSTNDRVVVAYCDTTDNYYGKAAVGTVSGSTISFGTPVNFNNGTTYDTTTVFASNQGKIIISYRDAGNSNYGTVIVGTVSGTSISFGTELVYNSQVTTQSSATWSAQYQRYVISYTNSGNYGYYRIASLSGTTLSFGTATVFYAGNLAGGAAGTVTINNSDETNTGNILIGYIKDGSSGEAVVGQLQSSTSYKTLSFGTPVVFNTVANTGYLSGAFDSTNKKMVLSFQNGNGPANTYAKCIVGTVSGTSLSFGSAVIFSTALIYYTGTTFDSAAGKIIIGYRDATSGGYGKYVRGAVSGTSISFESPVTFSTVAGNTAQITLTYDSDTQQPVVAYGQFGGTNNGAGTAAVLLATSSNVADYVGITDQAISSAATGKVVCKGGAITNTGLIPYTGSSGSPVTYMSTGGFYSSLSYDTNANKIVVANRKDAPSNYGVAFVGTVSGTSISFGAEATFNAANTESISSVFDPNSNKVVIAYQNVGSSAHGTAIVGTVSGTSISFGTAVVFEAAAVVGISIAFDSTNNKVVIFYEDDANSDYGTAIVGTVSGTSISFGTPVVFNSANTNFTGGESAVYDSANNRAVVFYRDPNAVGYGAVGTVSGTSISFGTPVKFSSGAAELNYISAAFDSAANKIVTSYRVNTDSGYGKAIVGTVSGTSISFGSESTFESASTNFTSATFNSTINKVVISYSDAGNSNYGTFVIATVSGTSISFSTPAVFSSTTAAQYIATTFDSDTSSVVSSYADSAASYHPKSVVTSFSNALTPNTAYFVQDDGTISTTSSTTKAGTALSTTSLLLTG